MIEDCEVSLRRRRFTLFGSLYASLPIVNRPGRILDVGGTAQYWKSMESHQLGEVEITLLNVKREAEPSPRFAAVVGDARNMSQYADNEFDVVYSNSVINVVGAERDQRAMAREIRRVGRAYFVQVPNRRFPIDWRTLVPFFHMLPIHVQAWCFRRFRVGSYRRVDGWAEAVGLASRVRDLSFGELRQLFPDATIARERILGVTKSFVAYQGFPSSLGRGGGEPAGQDSSRPDGGSGGARLPRGSLAG